MRIKDVNLPCNVFLAPMAGVTDAPFRVLCLKQGCGLVTSEMVSARGMDHGSLRSREIAGLLPEESPAAVQIFGSDPERMARAAGSLNESAAVMLDINMGCPTPKIVKNGDGCALMRNPVLAGEIIRAVVKASNKPVTVKMRKGWDERSVNAVELAKRAEDCGASAVTVHGRTREQFYSGSADWDIIARVRESLSIPVIGNGDIFAPEDAYRMIRHTGCQAVMVGRGAQGNPWIFRS
ncbi:MAG TPA: tRNA dihydrouridine synthase DusB, partial [Clostridiales bacterium]|nr:tRNA dihydrouridine synthase DusB [Clostridiales bacterium]